MKSRKKGFRLTARGIEKECYCLKDLEFGRPFIDNDGWNCVLVHNDSSQNNRYLSILVWITEGRMIVESVDKIVFPVKYENDFDWAMVRSGRV